jgi:hypothetical protein
MAQQDAVSSAKAALAHANQKFPSPAKPAVSAPAPAPKPASSTGEPEKGIGNELKAKSDNVDSYLKSLPKMHQGGEIPADGAYQMLAGEHVLTAAEAKKARKHALLAVGMKSLAKTSPKPKQVGAPTENDEETPIKGKQKSMAGINAKPSAVKASKIKIS